MLGEEEEKTMAVIDADTHVIETEHHVGLSRPSKQQSGLFVVTLRGESGRE